MLPSEFVNESYFYRLREAVDRGIDPNLLQVTVKDGKQRICDLRRELAKVNVLTPSVVREKVNTYHVSEKLVGILWAESHPEKAIEAIFVTYDADNKEARQRELKRWTATRAEQESVRLLNVYQSLSALTPELEEIPFISESKEFLYFIDHDAEGGIIEVFDNIQSSHRVPFVTYREDDRTYYKLDPSTKERPDEVVQWLNTEVENNQIVQYVWLGIRRSRPYYATITWSSPHIAIVSIPREFEDIQVLDNVFPGTIKHTVQLASKGRFVLPWLNRIVFTDMVLTDPLLSKVFSYDEHQKTMVYKSAHYSIKYLLIPNVTLSFTWVDDTTRVKVTGVRDEFQLSSIREVFNRVFTLYNLKRDEILTIYKTIVPKLPYQNQFVETDEDKDILINRKADPSLFVSNYSKVCGEFPLYIGGREDAMEYEGEHGEGKTIEFPPKSNRFYACCREINEKSGKVWPSLRKTSAALLSNHKEYPYIPCCLVNRWVGTQREKKAMKDYETKLKGGDVAKKSAKYVMRKAVPVFDGRKAVLPTTLNALFPELYRVGVNKGPNSLIECLKIALEDRRSLQEIRDAILSHQHPTQESCAGSLTNLDPDEPMDPLLYTSLIEMELGISLYTFSIENDGEYLLPKSFQAHLNNKRPEAPAVMIIRHPDTLQCELVGLFGRNSTVARTCYDMSLEVNKVSHLTGNRQASIPIIGDQKPGKVYLDSAMKARIFEYYTENGESVYLFSQPTVPPLEFNTHLISDGDTYSSSDKYLEFLAKNGIEVEQLTSYGAWTKYGVFLHTYEDTNKQDELISPIPTGDSVLSRYRDVKKKALYYQRRVLKNLNDPNFINSLDLGNDEKKALKQYLDIRVLNGFSENSKLPSLYQNLSDFSQTNGLLFLGPNSVLGWLRKYDRYIVKWRIHTSDENEQEEPYLFATLHINNGNLVLIQPTNTQESAVSIAREWFHKRYNPGYGFVSTEFNEPPMDPISLDQEVYVETVDISSIDDKWFVLFSL